MSGHVYVFYNPRQYKNLFKIGYTERGIEDRMRQICNMNPYDVEEFHSEKYTESLKAERIIHEHLHKYRLMRKDGTLKEWFRIPKPNRPDIFKAFNEARRIIDSDEPYVLSETEGDEPDSDDDDSDFVPNDEPDSEDNDSSESESDMDTDKDK